MVLLELDFSPGFRLRDQALAKFGTPISPSSNAPGFVLVATFSRSAIHLNEDSASLILQSCLGGLAKDLRVKWLSGWCFHFEVRSKAVGFLIYEPNYFACNSFAVHFSLWGNGGPNWKHEFSLWLEQEYREWTPIKPKRSYAAVVKHGSQAPRSVFRRLQYPVDYQKNYLNEIAQFLGVDGVQFHDQLMKQQHVRNSVRDSVSNFKIVSSVAELISTQKSQPIFQPH
jgi:hypothetical protein